MKKCCFKKQKCSKITGVFFDSDFFEKNDANSLDIKSYKFIFLDIIHNIKNKNES